MELLSRLDKKKTWYKGHMHLKSIGRQDTEIVVTDHYVTTEVYMHEHS